MTVSGSDYDWRHPQFTIYTFTAALSIIGSTWIIAEFLSDAKKRSMCYHRIVLACSIFNMLASIWFCVNTWAQSVPPGFFEESYDYTPRKRPWQGITCNMSGFSIYLSFLAIPWYKTALLVYYYLTVCSKWEEKKIRKKFEVYVHWIVGPLSVIVATIPFCFKLYNNFYSYCFVVNNNEDKMFLSQLFQLICVASVLLSTCIMLILIALIVTSSTGRKDSIENISIASKMALFYGSAFFVTYTIPVGWLIYATLSFYLNISYTNLVLKASYFMSFYLAVFLPLNGFLTWMVYIFPRFQKIRKRKDAVFCSILKDTLFWSCRKDNNEEHFEDCYLGSCTGNLEGNMGGGKSTHGPNPSSSTSHLDTELALLELYVKGSAASDSESVITCEAITTSYQVDDQVSNGSDNIVLVETVHVDQDAFMASNNSDCHSDDDFADDDSYDLELREACERMSGVGL